MPEYAPSPVDGRQLLLLFGMPRSGTTWLGKLFDSHPHVLYRHEPDTWRPLPALGDQVCRAEFAGNLRDFVAAMPDFRSLRVAGKRPLFAKAYGSSTGFQLMRASAELARVASRVYAEFPILVHQNGDQDAERLLVWKSIQSLGRLPEMLAMLEQARGIHILRHPCGYIASVRRGIQSKSFTDNSADSLVYGVARRSVGTPVGERFGFDDGHQQQLSALTPEERLAWHWVLINERVHMALTGSDRYLPVHYETICRDPLRGVQSMFDFAGLSVSDQTRDFVASSTQRSRADYYSVFKDPEVAAWRWRDELDSDTVQRVMAIVSRSDVGQAYLAMKPPESSAS
ncbi:sulfotransferase [Salinisphaera sp. T31B1]|uniref:sulfotransferase family protein n=1 Tax=Salinisphaera sp. T31B1 TaxID=727963 RepID=UPI00333F6670